MSSTYSIEKIIIKSQEAFNHLVSVCDTIPEEQFFLPPAEKWSPAQHLQHLIISTRTSTAAFALPKFIVRWVGGRATAPSRTYEELVDTYKQILSAGGKATGRYIPRPIAANMGKEKLIIRWKKVSDEYLSAIKKNRKDHELDKYVVKHPLLGKITLRELGYFTIYHTYHHIVSFPHL